MLTQERLKERVTYDPDTGIFLWKKMPSRGKSLIAGFIYPNGYIRIHIDGRKYLAHRLAWLYVYGSFPKNHIDHINRVRNDNRIANLRDVIRCMNQINCKEKAVIAKHGRCIVPHGRKFSVRIGVLGKQIFIGNFFTVREAEIARDAAIAKRLLIYTEKSV